MSRLVIAGVVVGVALGFGVGCAKKGPSTQRLGSQSFTDRQAPVQGATARAMAQSARRRRRVGRAELLGSVNRATDHPARQFAASYDVQSGCLSAPT